MKYILWYFLEWKSLSWEMQFRMFNWNRIDALLYHWNIVFCTTTTTTTCMLFSATLFKSFLFLDLPGFPFHLFWIRWASKLQQLLIIVCLSCPISCLCFWQPPQARTRKPRYCVIQWKSCNEEVKVLCFAFHPHYCKVRIVLADDLKWQSEAVTVTSQTCLKKHLTKCMHSLFQMAGLL